MLSQVREEGKMLQGVSVERFRGIKEEGQKEKEMKSSWIIRTDAIHEIHPIRKGVEND